MVKAIVLDAGILGLLTNPKRLDADMILAAQAIVQCPSDVVIATTNVKHFPSIVRADTWQNILLE